MKRLCKIGLCIAIALVVAMVMAIVMHFAYWPPRWKKIEFDILFAVAVLVPIYTAVAPLLVLGVIARYRTPTTFLSVSVSCVWLLAAFLLRAKKPWLYYGNFPWWMFQRDFIQLLPATLAVGLAFGVSARIALGPNNPQKPSQPPD